MKASICILSTLMLPLILPGCMSAQDHAGAVRDDSDKVTVGNVQREIHAGMSGADVAAVLGSPNVVTTNEDIVSFAAFDVVVPRLAEDHIVTATTLQVVVAAAAPDRGGQGDSLGDRGLVVFVA